MTDRSCTGCKSQAEWGCQAKKYREVRPGEDPAEGWIYPATLPLEVDGDENHFACPRQPLKEEPQAWQRMLLYYGMYQKGFLPQKGAVMDQSNRAIEVFRILDTVNQEVDAAQMAERQKRNS